MSDLAGDTFLTEVGQLIEPDTEDDFAEHSKATTGETGARNGQWPGENRLLSTSHGVLQKKRKNYVLCTVFWGNPERGWGRELVPRGQSRCQQPRGSNFVDIPGRETAGQYNNQHLGTMPRSHRFWIGSGFMCPALVASSRLLTGVIRTPAAIQNSRDWSLPKANERADCRVWSSSVAHSRMTKLLHRSKIEPNQADLCEQNVADMQL